MTPQRAWFWLLGSLAMGGCVAEVQSPSQGDTGAGDREVDARTDDRHEPGDEPAASDDVESPDESAADLEACPSDYCMDQDGFCDEGMACLDGRGEVASCDSDPECAGPAIEGELDDNAFCSAGALGVPCDGDDTCDSGWCGVRIHVENGTTTTDGTCLPPTAEPCFGPGECDAGLECFMLYGYAGQCVSAADQAEICACGQGEVVETCP